ncbi:flagellar basal-body MS-ring/collar protein FliF [Desulfotalea psychrophila]|nr:flagellar basal-body MS-ring/collar protein FliF [Desulfotalea psychrophila]
MKTPAKKNFFTLLRDWPLSRQLSLGAVLILCLAAFATIIIQTRTVDQQLLYANLSATDAAAVTEWLKGQKIPYSLKDSGKSVWIGSNKIYQARLDLAANGLPSGGGVGFEVFDKQNFALTNYVQKINYSRALQGELARTISSLAPIESTRVHLAIPEKRLFKNQQKQATASVILSLVPGKTLSQEQVEGIAYLVAGSVPGLETDNVKVLDSSGVILGDREQNGGDRALSSDMLAFQKEIETQMEMRAQDLLTRTMGADHALVRVTATVDFAKVEKTEEFFDADDPVIRSEQINNESSRGAEAGGIPGVESNLQGTQKKSGTGPSAVKNGRTTNYEISKTISHIVNPVGTVKKLSVSVLVADRQKLDPDTQEPSYTPFSTTELKALENMVASAIGLVATRGDVINVISMPFFQDPQEFETDQDDTMELVRNSMPLVKYLLALLAIFFLYFLLVRPILKTVKGEVLQHNKTVDEMEKEQQRRNQEKKEESTPLPPLDIALANIRQEVMQEHTPTAFIVKNWIHEG